MTKALSVATPTHPMAVMAAFAVAGLGLGVVLGYAPSEIAERVAGDQMTTGWGTIMFSAGLVLILAVTLQTSSEEKRGEMTLEAFASVVAALGLGSYAWALASIAGYTITTELVVAIGLGYLFRSVQLIAFELPKLARARHQPPPMTTETMADPDSD